MKKILVTSVVVNVVLVLVIGLLYYFAVPYRPFKNIEADDIKSIKICKSGTDESRLLTEVDFVLEFTMHKLEIYRAPVRSYEASEDEEQYLFVVELNNGKNIEFGGNIEYVDGDYYFLMNGRYYRMNGYIEMKDYLYFTCG